MPINEESVVKYENQFPALGESTTSETLTKSQVAEFTPEILNPQTIVQTSILKEAVFFLFLGNKEIIFFWNRLIHLLLQIMKILESKNQ